MTEFSFLTLINEATFFVQFILFVLFVASIVCWVVIWSKYRLYRLLSKNNVEFEQRFWSGIHLDILYKEVQAKVVGGTDVHGYEYLFYSSYSRIKKNKGKDTKPRILLESVEKSLKVAFTRENQRLNGGLTLMASIASSCPYIGLLGTVWGIIHSFYALSGASGDTFSLVSVGISEALIATAMGLLAAIPSQIFYNKMLERVDNFLLSYEAFSNEILIVFHHWLHVEKLENNHAEHRSGHHRSEQHSDRVAHRAELEHRRKRSSQSRTTTAATPRAEGGKAAASAARVKPARPRVNNIEKDNE